MVTHLGVEMDFGVWPCSQIKGACPWSQKFIGTPTNSYTVCLRSTECGTGKYL